MARFKGNKPKNKEKRPRGGGFGFNKSKEIREFEGHAPNYDAPHRSPITQHAMQEEVFVVNNVADAPSQSSTFDQLSRISMTHITSSKVDSEELNQTTEDFGFFFDSTPQPVSNPFKPNVSQVRQKRSVAKLHESKTEASTSNYQAKKRKIILDDSIHIDSEDDQDDASSISSSEDISMLDALAHWGSSNAMFEEEPAGHRFHSDDDEDYAILKNTRISDIFDSDQDIIDILDSDEEEEERASANAFKRQIDDSVNVPDHMKHSYRAVLKEEQRAQSKKQKKPKNKKPKLREAAKDKTKKNKKNLIDRITDEFMLKPKLSKYILTDLTHLGRHTIVPKLAKLFKLKIVEAKSSETIVELRRTPMTPTYQDLKKSTKRAKHRETRHAEKRVSRVQFKEDANHGKQVASSSTPIPSSNVGHRMLAAMGWKEGEAIGNNQNGIKEPVKVYLRAKQRGLGA